MTKEEFLNKQLPYIDFDAVVNEQKVTQEDRMKYSEVCTNVLIFSMQYRCDLFTIAYELLKHIDADNIGMHHNVLLNYVVTTTSMPDNIKVMAKIFAKSDVDVSDLLLLSSDEILDLNKRASFLSEIKPKGVKELYNVAVANDLSMGHYYTILLSSLKAAQQ